MYPWTGAGSVVVWPLGDSITTDAYAQSWRYLLAGLVDGRLRPSGAHAPALAYAGHLGGGRYLHSATAGIRADQLAAAVPGYALTATPTDVVIEAGINDLIAGASAATIRARLEALRDAVLARFPSARVWVLTLGPNAAPSALNVAPVNAEIVTLTGLNGGAVVDIHTGWSTGTMLYGDGLHWSATGQDYAATRLDAAMDAAGV